MILVYKKWDYFCEKLIKHGIASIPACEVDKKEGNYLVLKHDVETDVEKALELATIECKYGHKGSYYVQAYLLAEQRNIDFLKKMQKMGHEISYHYDVMDSNKGDLKKAISEFEINKRLFEKNGFEITTVCQHGNPVIERIGYTSNRDFFRSEQVQQLYPDIADIMVNYKRNYNTDYTYYSDAGRIFTKIYDPLNNDIINSDDKNIKYKDIDSLYDDIKKNNNVIISIHPHRWSKFAIDYTVRSVFFKYVKGVAKLLLHISGMKRIMGRYYYLAKKF